MPPPACVVAPANLIAHCTHKSGAIPLAGRLHLAGLSVDLAGGVASLDHSDGFLAHDTRWHWASAHARGFGFNLQAGYMDAAENVIWLGRTLLTTVVVVARAEAKVPLTGEVFQVRKARVVGAQGHSGHGTFPHVISCMAAGMDMLPMITKRIKLNEVPENIIGLRTDRR